MNMVSGRLIKVGHGGASSLAPANTWRSFVLALIYKVDMIEVDVRKSQDGHLVLIHDRIISAAPHPLEVGQTALTDLRRFSRRSGAPLVTLEEFLDFARNQSKVMLDIKEDGVASDLVTLLKTTNTSTKDLMIAGAGVGERGRIQALMPTMPISTTLEWDPDEVTSTALNELDTKIVTCHYKMLTRENVEKMKQRGLAIYAWTVDGMEKMRRLASLGVDGIISGRPDLFERGLSKKR